MELNFLGSIPFAIFPLMFLQNEEIDEMNEDEDESDDGNFKREYQFQVRFAQLPCVTKVLLAAFFTTI